MHYDVMVIGAGPAGSCAGAGLARAGQKVLLVEKEKFPRFRIGESLLPAGNQFFEEIGAWEKLQAAGFVEKYGAEFYDGKTGRGVHIIFANGFYGGPAMTFQVERAVFDQVLLDHAGSCGCQVRMETRVTAARRAGPAWEVELAGASAGTITADCIMDGSGRDTVMGRILKMPRDELNYPKRIAVYNHFAGVPRRTDRRGGNIHIVRLPGGWFWVIPLAGGKTSVGLVMPLDEAGGGQLRDPEGVFWHTVGETKLLPELMENAKPLDKYRVTADYCFCHSRFADDGLFMVGDAASFIDPIFSSGVSLACASANRAVEIWLRLKRSGRRFCRREQSRYSRFMKERVHTVRKLVESFYDPASFEIFMQPTNRWRVFPAVNAVMAGHHTLTWDARWRFQIFLIACALNRFMRRQPDESPAARVSHPKGETNSTAAGLDGAQLRQLFDASADIYDRVDALGSLGRGASYRQEVLQRAGLHEDARVLDVACGTGLMSLAASRLTRGKVTLCGVDPSSGMAARAQAKLPMEFHPGVAENLPVPDGYFDFAIMGYALRHVADWPRAFHEFKRVLRPGGRLLLLEITRPPGRVGRVFFDIYFGSALPLLGLLATGKVRAWRLYRYYWHTMAAARPPAAVLATLEQTGFAEVKHSLSLGCLSEYTATKI